MNHTWLDNSEIKDANMIEHKNLGCTEDREAKSGKPRVAFASQACYFGTYNEASVATRSLLECLATWGFPTMAMTGTVVEAGKELDPGKWLAEQGLTPEFFDGQADATSGIVPKRECVASFSLDRGRRAGRASWEPDDPSTRA